MYESYTLVCFSRIIHIGLGIQLNGGLLILVAVIVAKKAKDINNQDLVNNESCSAWLHIVFGILTTMIGFTFAYLNYHELVDLTKFLYHVIFLWNLIVFGQILPIASIWNNENMKGFIKTKLKVVF